MCYLARFNPTESKDTLAIYESSLVVTILGKCETVHGRRGLHQSKKSGISVWFFSKRSSASLVKEAKELRRIDDDRVIDRLVEAASQTDDSIVNGVTEQAMHHVAGYLARTTMNSHECQPRQDLLVNREASQG